MCGLKVQEFIISHIMCGLKVQGFIISHIIIIFENNKLVANRNSSFYFQ